MTVASPQAKRGCVGRMLRALVALVLGVALGLLAAEGAVRALLFSDIGVISNLGRDMRKAQKIVGLKTESDYFKLRYLWKEEEKAPTAHKLHSDLGWVSAWIDAENLDHGERKNVIGRKPILMYGDSYVACTTPVKDCWQGLMRRNALRDQMYIVNYGVRGYGLGQTWMLMRESIDLWVEYDPTVVIGIYVDDDLDRVVFHFRSGPKPSFLAEEGELIIQMPKDVEQGEWMDAYPLDSRSYLYSYLSQGTELLPEDWRIETKDSEERIAQKRDASHLILMRLKEDLEASGLDYFFFIFEGPRVAGQKKKRRRDWRHQFLYPTLNELEIPWVSSEIEFLRELRNNKEAKRSDFFIPDRKPGGRHFNALGNQVAMRALLRGIGGEFDGAVKQRPKKESGAQPQKN